jgi:nucleoid DNA-binding protein
LWTHRKGSELSRRRQFVVKMKDIGTSNVVYQAFVDSLYLHLCHGKNVTITGIGTLRINQSKRISFRTSNKFRKIYKESVAQSQIGDGNVG